MLAYGHHYSYGHATSAEDTCGAVGPQNQRNQGILASAAEQHVIQCSWADHTNLKSLALHPKWLRFLRDFVASCEGSRSIFGNFFTVEDEVHYIVDEENE